MASTFDHVILLEGNFHLYPKISSEYYVVVTNKQINCCERTKRQDSSDDTKSEKQNIIKFSDVVGCECRRGKSADSVAAHLIVYAYSHHKKFASKTTVRKRLSLELCYSLHGTFDENHQEMQKWCLVMKYLIRKQEIRSPEEISSLSPFHSQKLLVLVNPFSGPGKAKQLFQHHAAQIFAEAGLQYELIITERAGHARDMVKTIDLNEWYGIVIVSGDGLIYEVLNGLMERADWEKAIKMPVGALPGGSGNALAAALAYQAGEPYLEKHMMHAAFAICKHTVMPMDLVAVDTCTGKRLYSFLSVAWGIISDVDIESERFRSIGNARFTLGAVTRILDLRKYRGRLSYLPADKSMARSVSCCEGSGPVKKSGNDTAVTRSVSLQESTSVGVAAEANQNVAMQGETEHASGDNSPHVSMPPLNSPVPSDWVTVDDEFILVSAVYQSHLALDMIAAPHSKPNDGIIYLGYTLASITKVRLLKLFTAMQEGKEIDDPSTKVIRVKAFRLEPLSGGPAGRELGRMTVDGELVDSGPIQGEVLPSLARIMTLVK